MNAVVEIAVLGPLEVYVDGESIPLGERARALVAALAARRGADVRADLLLDVVWPDGAPDGGRNALQALVSRTRRALGAGGHVLATRPVGYRLDVPAEATDAGRLEAAVHAARSADEVDVERLRSVVACWRGDPFVEVADDPDAAAAAARLVELRLEAVERHAAAVAAAGGGADLVADLRGLATEHPTREPLHRALATALYLAGRQTDALEVVDVLGARLRDELGLDPDPRTDELRIALLRHQVRGSMTRERVPKEAPATSHPRSRPLPLPRTSFVGREEERRALGAVVQEHRLVTLVGPGGAGKTRLAIQVLVELDPAPRDGFVFVDLAPLTDPSDALPELAAAVGLEAMAASRPAAVGLADRSLLDRVRDRLRHTEMILLVDNCEHVVDAAAATIEHVLEAAPDVRVVATSREGLRIDGERVWPVHPLTVARGASEGGTDGSPRWLAETGGSSGQGAETAAELLRYDAPRLFAERARAADPTFHLDDTTAPAVAEICRRLDGLPLGIELAAARVGTLPVTTLADRLEDRFRLLTAGRRTVRRQETLEAVVSWSYDLLDDEQRRTLRRLGVFSGTVPLSLVEEVLGTGSDAAGLLPALTALAERSLVVLHDDASNATADAASDAAVRGPRVAMLETVRAFAQQRLMSEDDAAVVRDRHAEVIAGRAARAASELRGPDQLRWFAALHDEIDEHRAAFAWLVATDPIRAVELSSDLAWYAWLRERHEEAVRALHRSLAAAGDAVPDELVARSRAWLAYLLSFVHRQEEADEQAELALAALDRAGEEVTGFVRFGVPLLTAYVAVFGGGDLAGLVARMDGVITDAERCGETWLVTAGRYVTAVVRSVIGDRVGARQEHHLGIDAARACGDRWAEFQHRLQLAIELMVDGEYAAAADHVDRAIPLGEAIGAYGQVRTARIHRAVAAMHAGDAQLAERIVHDVLGVGGIDAASGAAGGYALTTLADLRRRQGDAAGARELARRAEQVYLEVDERAGDIVACVIGALSACQLGDAADARGCLDRAVSYATNVPPVSLGTGVAFLLEASAAVDLAEGGASRASEAAQRLGRAAALREAAGRPLVGSERHHIEPLERELAEVLGSDRARAEFAAGRDRRGLLPPLD